MLERIRPDGTCDLHDPETGKLLHDDYHLGSVEIDWLITLWNRYVELSVEQGTWKENAFALLTAHTGAREAAIRCFVED